MVCDYSGSWYNYYYGRSGAYYTECTNEGLNGYNNYYERCCDVKTWRLWYSFMWIGIFLLFTCICIAMAKARAARRQAYMSNRAMQQQPEVIVVNGQTNGGYNQQPYGGQQAYGGYGGQQAYG